MIHGVPEIREMYDEFSAKGLIENPTPKQAADNLAIFMAGVSCATYILGKAGLNLTGQERHEVCDALTQEVKRFGTQMIELEKQREQERN